MKKLKTFLIISLSLFIFALFIILFFLLISDSSNLGFNLMENFK